MKKVSIALMILVVAAALNGCTYSSGAKVATGENPRQIHRRRTRRRLTRPTTASRNSDASGADESGSDRDSSSGHRDDESDSGHVDDANGDRCRSIRYTEFF